ncbi:hypothetical protein, partial [uncultured Methylobacterium sp.]|uniref:hypothetical protein n=1 Tax=uncultured Methylobacterium sp. TaxID=157278 RepID=UPI0025929608
RDDEVIVVSFDEMRNAALGDGEGNVHASHDGEGGSGHHRPEAIHRHPRKVSKNRFCGRLRGLAEQDLGCDPPPFSRTRD